MTKADRELLNEPIPRLFGLSDESTEPVKCTAPFHSSAVVVNGVRYCTECQVKTRMKK